MQSEEKKLIENLFDRLQKTENKYPNKNKLADELISNLLKKQPNASYYIIQTVLIQEVAIKKLNEQITELKNKISALESLVDKKEPSFLSGLFRRSPSNVMKKENSLGTFNNEKPIVSNQNSEGSLNVNNTRSGTMSFIGNALQTAAGVTGGILMGNALLNLFHKDKPEEEIITTMRDSNFSSLENHNFNNTDQFCSQDTNDSLLHTANYNENIGNNEILNNEESILNDEEILLDGDEHSFDSNIDDDNLI